MIERSGRPFSEIERATGVSADTIQRFMKGHQSLLLENVEKLLRFFDVEVMLTRSHSPLPQFAALYQIGVSPMSRIINAVAEAAGLPESTRTQGHFLTTESLEAGVKIQILRRKRGDRTVLAIGIACDTGDGSLNRRLADEYLGALRKNRPPGELEEFPSSKVNQYRTIVKTVPSGDEALARFVRECAVILKWYHAVPYGSRR